MSTNIDIRLSIFRKSFFSNALLAVVPPNSVSTPSSLSQFVLPISQVGGGRLGGGCTARARELIGRCCGGDSAARRGFEVEQ